MNKKVCFLFLLVTAAFYGIKAQFFMLEGISTGVEDSTWIYIRPTNDDNIIDSTRVINGVFNLKGNLKEKVMRVYLYTKGYKNYTSLWLEDKAHIIYLTEGKFKESVLLGSAVNREYQAYLASLQYLYNQNDSIMTLVKKTCDTTRKKLLRKELQLIKQQQQDFEISYVKQYPDSWIAANTLNIYKNSWNKQLVTKLYEGLSPSMQQTTFGQAIKRFLQMQSRTHNIGDAYTEIVQQNPDGRTIKLSDYKGKYVLLEFWGSWCQPCREENPLLVSLYRQYRPKGFEILGVSLELGKKEWLEAIKTDKITWQNVSELNGDENSAYLAYNLDAVPSNFLINDKGVIIAKNLRGERLAQKLKELLAK